MNVEGKDGNISGNPLPPKPALSKISKVDQKIAGLAKGITRNIRYAEKANYRQITSKGIVDTEYDMPKVETFTRQQEIDYIKNRIFDLTEDLMEGRYLNDEEQDFLKDGQELLSKSITETTDIPAHLKKTNSAKKDKLTLPGVSLRQRANRVANEPLSPGMKEELDNVLNATFFRLDKENNLFVNNKAIMEDMYLHQPMKHEEKITKEEFYNYYTSYSNKDESRELPHNGGKMTDSEIAKKLSDELGVIVDLTKLTIYVPTYSKEVIKSYLKEVPLQEKIVEFMTRKKP